MRLEYMHGYRQQLQDCLESKQEYNVKWRNVPVTESVQTEFILKKNVIDSEEDFIALKGTHFWYLFLYKDIVSFTIGKIKVQGKAYQTWCDKEFSETLDLVNKIMQNQIESSSEDNQILSGGETSDDCSLASEDNTGSIQLLGTEEDLTYVKDVYADRGESEETENHPLNSESDKHLKALQLGSKLDRLENALSKLSEMLTWKETEKPTPNPDSEKQSETQEYENKWGCAWSCSMQTEWYGKISCQIAVRYRAR